MLWIAIQLFVETQRNPAASDNKKNQHSFADLLMICLDS